MTIRSTLTTVLTAAFTCTALLVFTPTSDLIAKSHTPPVRPASVVETEQVHLTLARIPRESESKDPTCVRIVARNKTNKPVTVAVALIAQTPAPPSNGLRRMMPMPTVQWKETVSVSLGANESKTIDLKKPVGETSQVVMTCGGKGTLMPAIKVMEQPKLKMLTEAVPTQKAPSQK